MKVEAIAPPPPAKEFLVRLSFDEAQTLRAITQLNATIPNTMRQYPVMAHRADKADTLLVQLYEALDKELT